MASAEVERLLREIALDQVVPVAYSRTTLLGRLEPLALTTVRVVFAVLLGIATGDRSRIPAPVLGARTTRRPATRAAPARRALPPRGTD